MLIDTRNLETIEIERLATIIEHADGALWGRSLQGANAGGFNVDETYDPGWLALRSEAKTLAKDLRAIIRDRIEAENVVQKFHDDATVGEVFLTETKRRG